MLKALDAVALGQEMRLFPYYPQGNRSAKPLIAIWAKCEDENDNLDLIGVKTENVANQIVSLLQTVAMGDPDAVIVESRLHKPSDYVSGHDDWSWPDLYHADESIKKQMRVNREIVGPPLVEQMNHDVKVSVQAMEENFEFRQLVIEFRANRSDAPYRFPFDTAIRAWGWRLDQLKKNLKEIFRVFFAPKFSLSTKVLILY